MDDAALAYQAENGAIFARVSPEQKNRVILALKARGHVVGYIGDGINDAPSLHTADVGISVMNGVEVAKDAAEDHPAGEGSRGPERRSDRGAALLRQHHEVHHHGHEFELRQHVH
jgi:3-deoxy-D-manno-octulosonate 8-phosphate phosphatase KdsC-like HAD superfamily phosphatase